MNQLINRAVSELGHLSVPENLSERTLRQLPVLPVRKRTSFVAPVLVSAAVLAACAFVLPRYATARTIASIEQAVKGKMVHIRTYAVQGDSRLLEGEMWTNGTILRAEEKGKVSISDGSKTIEINHEQRTARVYAGAAFAHKPSGFTLDAILSDMGKTQNLGSIETDRERVDGRDALVAKFTDRYSHFKLICDAESRLPYRIEIADKKSDKKLILELSYLESVDHARFRTTVPDGYKVIDVDRGFDGFVQDPILVVEHDKAKFELFACEINEHGDIFVLFGTDHLRDVTLDLDTSYAGPLRMEEKFGVSEVKVSGRKAHVIAWSTDKPDLATVALNIQLFGVKESRSVPPNRIKGEPDYFEYARDIARSPPDVSLAQMREALSKPLTLPVVREDGLEITTEFDAVKSIVSGSVRNSTTKHKKDVAFVYKTFGCAGVLRGNNCSRWRCTSWKVGNLLSRSLSN